jgi:hypothetical protein
MINLEQFEHLAYTRQRAPAIRQLLQLLEGIDACSGELERALATSKPSGSLTPQAGLVARVTAAISALASEPDFVLSLDEYRALMVHHGWLGALFGASAFGHADHVLRALSIDGGSSGELRIAGRNLPAFCLFYFAESELPLNIEALWAIGPRLAAGLFVSLLAAPFLGTPAAHEKQQRLLTWLTAHLAEIGDLDYLPAAVLYRVYMRCSYADRPEKHAIKRPINQLIRAKLRQRGLADRAGGAAPAAAGGKPAVLVVVDWFQHGHSIYRTHSRAIDGLRSRFHVVGAGYPESVDEAGRAVFDEFHALSPTAGIWQNLEELRDLAAARGAQILYMPSVGMSTLGM